MDPEPGCTCRWTKLLLDVVKGVPPLLRGTLSEVVEVPVWKFVQELKELLCMKGTQGRKLEIEIHPSGREKPCNSLRVIMPRRGNIFASSTGQALVLFRCQVESTISLPTGQRVSSQDSLWRRKAKSSLLSNLCQVRRLQHQLTACANLQHHHV